MNKDLQQILDALICSNFCPIEMNDSYTCPQQVDDIDCEHCMCKWLFDLTSKELNND